MQVAVEVNPTDILLQYEPKSRMPYKLNYYDPVTDKFVKKRFKNRDAFIYEATMRIKHMELHA